MPKLGEVSILGGDINLLSYVKFGKMSFLHVACLRPSLLQIFLKLEKWEINFVDIGKMKFSIDWIQFPFLCQRRFTKNILDTTL